MAYSRPVLAGVGLSQNPTALNPPLAGVQQTTLDADIATTTSLGLVQIGAGLQINQFGVLSTTSSPVEHCSSITITKDYTATLTDYYIFAKPTGPITLTLPEDPPDCTQYVIKLAYNAPVGTKKVTVVPEGSATIDGLGLVVMTTPYQVLNIVSYNKTWYVI